MINNVLKTKHIMLDSHAYPHHDLCLSAEQAETCEEIPHMGPLCASYVDVGMGVEFVDDKSACLSLQLVGSL